MRRLLHSETEPDIANLAAPKLSTIASYPFNWTYAFTITTVHLLALLAVFPWFFSWAGVITMAVGAIGGIRPSADFTMELHDPRRQRTLRHRYHVETLPVVA